MTRQRSFKARVRGRMRKTGESYTAARRQLLPDAEPSPPPRDPGRRPYSDEVLTRRTGRPYGEWFALLDEWGGAGRSHRDIVQVLVDEHGVGGWWAQGVAVQYEQARGMRVPGERCDGTFAATATKTVAAPAERVLEAFTDPATREQWLPDVSLRLGAIRPGKPLRADCDDGTRVEVTLVAKDVAKCQVKIDHQRLPDADTVATAKELWRARLAVLKDRLER